MRGRLQGHLTGSTLSPQDPALMAPAASRLLLCAVNKGPESGAPTEAWVHFVTLPTTTPGARDPVPSSRGRRPKAARGQGLAPGASLGALDPEGQPSPLPSPGSLGGKVGSCRSGAPSASPAKQLGPGRERSVAPAHVQLARCFLLQPKPTFTVALGWLPGEEKDDTNDSIFHFPDPTQCTLKMWKFY